MSDASNRAKQYYELLNLYGDYVRTGFRSAHAAPVLKKPDDTAARKGALEKLGAEVRACTRCDLCHNRLKAVPGEGTLDPLVMVVGEAPGADEDETGRPFVGAAGQYLDKWLQAIHVTRRTNAYIANVIKCRPPQNRDPRPEETGACLPYLTRQVELLRPRFILVVGRVAAQVLLREERGIGALRGGTYRFQDVPLVPTYHPSAVLRDQSLRARVWDDLKRLKSLFEHA
ncbi:MAG: uracil-DNA glycosylase [Spirochaetales bacterium]|nr:uracil-DNA glycosylase [Spirochaetales bacterium]